MLTTFEQVREWITDNGLKRWMLFKDYSRKEKILDSNAFPSDLSDKIAMTEKYLLRSAGGHAYAAGGTTAGANDMDVVAEIRLQDIQQYAQPTQGVGGGFDASTIGQLRDELSKSIRAEIRAEQYEKERAEFERDRKEFEAEKQSAIGVLIHCFAPIGQQLMAKHIMPKVAGVDAEEPVHTAPIVVDRKPDITPNTEEPGIEEPEQEEPFTDEEAEQLMALMVRFKAVEPRFMELIESVVTMAENGDATYNMAKGFLLK